MTANEYAAKLREHTCGELSCNECTSQRCEAADLLERQARRKPCPCLHTTPCHPRCTCVQPLSSRGCIRCCTYGSPEEQREMAEALASTGVLLAAAQERERVLQRSHDGFYEENLNLTAKLDAARERERELREALAMLYDYWEHGTCCYEDPDEPVASEYHGKAFRLDGDEQARCITLLAAHDASTEETDDE